MRFEDILKEAGNLFPVPLQLNSALHENQSRLIELVDRKMSEVEHINEIIGGNPLKIMFDNHRHHFLFMTTVFSIHHFELLARTIAWVYRAYHSHGFKYEYFPLELQVWIEVYEGNFSPEFVKPVTDIYKWMISHHDDFCVIADSEIVLEAEQDKNWLEIKENFKAGLLEGDHRKCLKLTCDSIKVPQDVEKFFMQVIQASMYEVGMLWETARITVAQEHMASAIVSRVMTAINMLDMVRLDCKGKAIVTSANNEFHEVGGWMLADLLDQDGWDVDYLGANTPINDLLDLVKSSKPDFLAVSVTMPFNLGAVRDVIELLKKDPETGKVKVMVGGKAFNENSNLWKTLGADGFAANVVDARLLARSWRKE